MNPILQMDLKIINAHKWTRCIQFPRTIFTLDPRVIAEFGIWRDGAVGANADGLVCFGGDGCVTHCAFEEIVRVFLAETF
jgi:hypothetical protein